MTETGTRTEERVLASDLWSVPKSRGPMTLEEEFEAWRATTRVLDSLCGMADGLMLDPLILALADALGRAREERRAEDRLTRPEGAHLGPREAERLMGLMRRSDALNTAFFALKDAEHAYPDVKAEYLEVIREAQEASRSSSHATAQKSASPTTPPRQEERLQASLAPRGRTLRGRVSFGVSGPFAFPAAFGYAASWVGAERTERGKRMGLLGGSGGKNDKDEGAMDKAKGRMKEAGGSLTGDKKLKREGSSDQRKGKAKQKKGNLKDLLS